MPLPTYTIRNTAFLLLILLYIMMTGGGVYEQLNVTRVVAEAPPRSLAMLQGPYGFNPVLFWITFRPITLLLIVAAAIVTFKTPARRLVLTAFFIDVCVILSTYLYFAPETGSILSVPYADNANPELSDRVTLWKNLNYIRLGAMLTACWFMLKAYGVIVSNGPRPLSVDQK
jgi:hypothetical protein